MRNKKTRIIGLTFLLVLLIGCGGGGGGVVGGTDPITMEAYWNSYKSGLDSLAPHFEGRPTTINVSPEWFKSLQVHPDHFSTRTDVFDTAGTRNPTHGVGYGSYASLPNNREFIFYSNWGEGPGMGTAFALEYVSDVPQQLHYLPIGGATHSWVLKNLDGSQTVLFLGIDEGQFESGGDGCSPSFTFDLNTQTWNTLDFKSSSHNSIPFDFDDDGDDDIVATGGCDGAWHSFDELFYVFRNDNGAFTPIPITDINQTDDSNIPGWINGGSVAPLGFQDDGTFALFIGDGEGRPEFGVAHKQNAIFYFSPDLTEIVGALPLPFPYFEAPVFSGISSSNFSEDHVAYSHDVTARALDLESDGDLDLIVSSMIWSNAQPYNVLQILINDNGVYIDDTENRLYNWSLIGGGIHRIDYLDVNGDGFVDILVSDLGSAFESNISLTANSRVLVNDGTGHFVTVIHQQINDQGESLPSYIPSLNTLGRLRWTAFNPGSDRSTVPVITRSVDFKLSTGPNMADPAALGAPGFNEFYYLLHNPDVIDDIENGTYTTGLDHFLAIGKSEGRRSYAEGAIF